MNIERQQAEMLTRVTVERVRTIEVLRVVIDDDPPQMRLPGLDEPVTLNVIDGDEARELLEQANARTLPKAGEGGT